MEATASPDNTHITTYERMLASLQDLCQEDKEIAVMNYWLSLTFKQRKSMTFEQREALRCINRWYDELGHDFGDLYEYEIPEMVWSEFEQRGYHFTEMAKGGCTILGEDGKTKAAIDLWLQNSDTTMAVKLTEIPEVKHIAKHISRLEILRDHQHKRNNLRRVEGAIAGALFGTEEKKATIEAGLYVIEQSGDTMKIDVPDDFVPRRF